MKAKRIAQKKGIVLLLDEAGNVVAGKVFGDYESEIRSRTFNCVIWLNTPSRIVYEAVQAGMKTHPLDECIQIEGQLP